VIDQVRGPGDTQDTFREAPRCGGGAPEYIVPGGPDAAWAIGDIYCGSLTGDSGGAGRRLRLMFWTETVKPSARRADTERTTSSSRGLTAIILRLRWSSRRRLFGAAASFAGRTGRRLSVVFSCEASDWPRRGLSQQRFLGQSPGGDSPCSAASPTTVFGTVPWRGQSLRAQQPPLHAARDDDHLSGHVPRELVGGEDDDLVGDVLGLGDLS
jgi:hypothetical protein